MDRLSTFLPPHLCNHDASLPSLSHHVLELAHTPSNLPDQATIEDDPGQLQNIDAQYLPGHAMAMPTLPQYIFVFPVTEPSPCSLLSPT